MLRFLGVISFISFWFFYSNTLTAITHKKVLIQILWILACSYNSFPKIILKKNFAIHCLAYNIAIYNRYIIYHVTPVSLFVSYCWILADKQPYTAQHTSSHLCKPEISDRITSDLADLWLVYCGRLHKQSMS